MYIPATVFNFISWSESTYAFILICGGKEIPRELLCCSEESELTK